MISLQDLSNSIPHSEIAGDQTIEVERLVHPFEAGRQTDLTFLTDAALAQPFVERLSQSGTTCCAIIARGVWDLHAATLRPALTGAIVVSRPRHALARACIHLPRRPQRQPYIHPSAVIDPGAEVGDGCSIGAGAVINANVVLGKGTVIHSNVVIEEEAILGEHCVIHPGVYIGHQSILGVRVIIHPNAVIGASGFAFDTAAPNAAEKQQLGKNTVDTVSQQWERIESYGIVRIGDDVEIGAGTTVDCAAFGETRIQSGVKIDNLVQVAHNCTIGENTLLCAQVGVAGSSTIGHDCILAGKVGVADHLKVEPHTVILAKSGVTRNLPGNAVYYGMPARPVKDTLRIFSFQSKIAKLKNIFSFIRTLNSSSHSQDQ